MTLPTNLQAITFDFGNTLVPVDRARLRGVVELTGRRVDERLGPFGLDPFLAAWTEERDRQFAEDIPAFREVDIGQRFIRVLARLRGVTPPPREVPWDDVAAARLSRPDEIAWALEVYVDAWVEAVPAPPTVRPLLERLSQRYRLGVVSNWPLAASIDRYFDAVGWAPLFSAVAVSERVGAIKPDRAIFDFAARMLGVPGNEILHVGDDWAADVVGAKRAGWRAAYFHGRPDDSPLPSSTRDATVEADLELHDLLELDSLLMDGLAARSGQEVTLMPRTRHPRRPGSRTTARRTP